MENFTNQEQELLHQAVRLLASRVSTKSDEGNILVLADETHALLKNVLSPTTVILSESVANTKVMNDIRLKDAIVQIQEDVGMLTANYDATDAEAFVCFADETAHPFVEHVVEVLSEGKTNFKGDV